jgi:hypothetical protein
VDPRTKHRRTSFRVAAVAFPFVAVAATNLALYLSDVGVNTEFILRTGQGIDSKLYLNPRADYVYGLFDLRGPEPRAFARAKPKTTMRIIVVGESSVQGFPYSSELAFPRQLQLVLERQLTGRQFEVINAGIVGISSTPLVDVVQHLVGAAPDLIVVYAGHNEFYGVGGVASKVPAVPSQFAVRRFRLAQAIIGQSNAGSADGDLIASLPRQLEIAADDPLVHAAEQMYSRNLAAIVECCRRNHVPIVLCSPVSNLRDRSPRCTTDEPDGPRSNWNSTSGQTDGGGQPQVPATERARWEKACRLRPENAAFHFRLAQSCEAAGDRPAALSEYTIARDLDVCRYRAPSRFCELLREMASRDEMAAVRYLDLTPAFEWATPFAAPGEDLFLEHVHFNFEGHWLVARTLGRFIIEEVLVKSWNPEAVPDSADRDAWLGVIPEDHLTAHVLAWFLTRGVPFDQAIDAERHQSALASKVRSLTDALTPDQQRRLFALPHQTKIDDLVDGLGRALLQERQAEQALQYFQVGERRRPWMPNSRVFAAVCLHQLGRDREARQTLATADESCLPPFKTLVGVRDKLEAELADSAGD